MFGSNRAIKIDGPLSKTSRQETQTNRLFVGSELRMIELKIKALEERLNKGRLL